MKYQGAKNFDHGQRAKLGVLLTNLGTPDAPTPKALRRYLGQFLADPRVVEVPRLLWRVILHGVILRIRPKKSAEAYRTVWTDKGSPLLLYTQAQAEGVANRLHDTYGDDVQVAFGMRYGQPSIARGLQELFDGGVEQLVVLPLYPQYSGSTSGSTFDALAADFTGRRWLPELRFVNCYHDHPHYIKALANKVRAYWEEHGKADRLVLSYHGVPKKYLLKGDPYHCQCYKTSRLLAEELGLGDDDYMTTFQSRFGREEWLQPYTDETMMALPGQGVKHVQVMCPGFSSDCLETIEEIDEENREYFMENGGESFAYIPCLNDDAEHLDLIAEIVQTNLQGWTPRSEQEASQTKERAQALGAEH